MFSLLRPELDNIINQIILILQMHLQLTNQIFSNSSACCYGSTFILGKIN